MNLLRGHASQRIWINPHNTSHNYQTPALWLWIIPLNIQPRQSSVIFQNICLWVQVLTKYPGQWCEWVWMGPPVWMIGLHCLGWSGPSLANEHNNNNNLSAWHHSTRPNGHNLYNFQSNDQTRDASNTNIIIRQNTKLMLFMTQYKKVQLLKSKALIAFWHQKYSMNASYIIFFELFWAWVGK